MIRRAAVLGLLLVISCAGDDGLGDVLLSDGPPRYEVVRGPASGPLDADSAAGATTIDRDTFAKMLDDVGFTRGHMRTWQRGEGDFAVAAVFQTRDDRAAIRLVGAMAADLLAKDAALAVEAEGVPGARAFTLAATQREGDSRALCHVIVFPVEARAFEIRACAPRETPFEPVRVLAARQRRAAASAASD